MKSASSPHQKTLVLSKRQFPMLNAFTDQKDGDYMSIEEAQVWDQRPFRSMLIRGYVAFRPRYGFHVTKEGKTAMHDFVTTDILRKNPTLPLTAYFDPTAYGLSPGKKARKKAETRKNQVPRKGSVRDYVGQRAAARLTVVPKHREVA